MKHNKRVALIGGFCLILALVTLPLMAACAPEVPLEKESYKFGSVLCLTGFGSYFGIPMRELQLLAVEEINKKGGINGHPVELIIYDDESAATTAVLKVKQLINEDKVLAIAGLTLSGNALAAGEIIEEAGIALITPSPVVQYFGGEYKYCFVISLAQNEYASLMFDYCKENNLTKIGILAESTTWGQQTTGAFKDAISGYPITIVAEETAGPSDLDMTGQLIKIKAAGANAILACGSATVPLVKQQMATLGMDMPLLCSHAQASSMFIGMCGEAANGAIVPMTKALVGDQLPDNDPQKPEIEQLGELYGEKHGKPLDPNGCNQWDAMQVLFAAAEKAGPDRAGIRDEIEKTKGFVGVNGVYTFSPKQHQGPPAESVVLTEVVNLQFKLLRP